MSPGLISAELTKAYEYGARQIWVFNVGDIKPAEKELSLAMEMAWNVKSYEPSVAHRFTEDWISKTFGSNIAKPLSTIQDKYYQLMAYGKEFHTRWLEYTEKEIAERLEAWASLSAEVEDLGKQIPERLKTAYYELFTYLIQGAAAMNSYVLNARMSRVLASQRNEKALAMAAEATASRDKVEALTNYYNNNLAGGKWGNFFNWHPNWYLDGKKEVMDVADEQLLEQAKSTPSATWILMETPDNRPALATQFAFNSDAEGKMPLWIKARTHIRNNSFAAEDNEFATVDINGMELKASALPHGNVWHTDTIGPMWSYVGEILAHKGDNILSLKNIEKGTAISAIYVGIQPPFVPEAAIRIKAEDYIAKKDASGSTITTVQMLGYNNGVTTLPFLTPSYDLQSLETAPWVEYDLPTGKSASLLEVRMLPTLRIYEGRDARFAVSIDGGKPSVFSIHEGDYTSEWRWNVLRGYARRFVPLTSGAGKVRIYLLDPGITLEELLVR